MPHTDTTKQKILHEVEAHMRAHVPASRKADDGSPEPYFRHVLGVRRYAVLLANKYGADQFIVEIAALLHDIGADAEKQHAQKSAAMSKTYLTSLHLDQKTEDHIISCIASHSMGSAVETLEQQIVQDADGLIFLEDTYQEYYDWKKQKHGLSAARTITIEKVQGMANKIKTEEGVRLATPLLAQAVQHLQSDS